MRYEIDFYFIRKASWFITKCSESIFYFGRHFVMTSSFRFFLFCEITRSQNEIWSWFLVHSKGLLICNKMLGADFWFWPPFCYDVIISVFSILRNNSTTEWNMKLIFSLFERFCDLQQDVESQFLILAAILSNRRLYSRFFSILRNSSTMEWDMKLVFTLLKRSHDLHVIRSTLKEIFDYWKMKFWTTLWQHIFILFIRFLIFKFFFNFKYFKKL